jgi:hypothetical protein
MNNVLIHRDAISPPSCGITIVNVTGTRINSGRKLNISNNVRPIIYRMIVPFRMGKWRNDSMVSTGNDCIRKRIRRSPMK